MPKEYFCSNCGYSNDIRKHVEKHIKKKSGCGENPTIENRDIIIQCYHCHKYLNSRRSLKKHINSCKKCKDEINKKEVEKIKKENEKLKKHMDSCKKYKNEKNKEENEKNKEENEKLKKENYELKLKLALAEVRAESKQIVNYNIEEIKEFIKEEIFLNL